MQRDEPKKKSRNKLDKDDIKILNELGRRDFSCILNHFKIPYADKGSFLNTCCPLPGHTGDGDNWSAFSFQYDTGMWACWTHHCEERYGRDVIGFVKGMRECSFKEAVEWLQNFMSDTKNLDVSEISIDDVPDTKKRKKESIVIHRPIPDMMLDYLDYSDDSSGMLYMLGRGFSKSVLKKFEVGYWERFGTYMHKRVIIPVRDAEGRIVFFTGRTLEPKEVWSDKSKDISKWLHARNYVKYNKRDKFSKTSVVFNLHNVIKKKYDSIILVEGPFDGFKLEMAGIYNWGACLGGFSPVQQRLLMQAGIKSVVLAFDPDDSGRRGTQTARALLADVFSVKEIAVPEPYDVGSLSVATLRELIGV